VERTKRRDYIFKLKQIPVLAVADGIMLFQLERLPGTTGVGCTIVDIGTGRMAHPPLKVPTVEPTKALNVVLISIVQTSEAVEVSGVEFPD